MQEPVAIKNYLKNSQLSKRAFYLKEAKAFVNFFIN